MNLQFSSTKTITKEKKKRKKNKRFSLGALVTPKQKVSSLFHSHDIVAAFSKRNIT